MFTIARADGGQNLVALIPPVGGGPAATVIQHLGPDAPTSGRIGRSGFANWQEVGQALQREYQRAYNAGDASWRAMTPEERAASSGRHRNAQEGSYIDRRAARAARAWLRSEGIAEGPSERARIGRRLYNPLTPAQYVVPDVYMPGVGIWDGSVSDKTRTSNNNQIGNMLAWSRQPSLTIVRPTARGGSYDILRSATINTGDACRRRQSKRQFGAPTIPTAFRDGGDRIPMALPPYTPQTKRELLEVHAEVFLGA